MQVLFLIAWFAAAFSVWAPELFKYYKDHLDPLLEKMKHLRKHFKKSVFTSAAFNFGPNVCTFSHRDCMNCPFGWCAIQSLGSFDHTLGGHLVLEDLKLLIEFPPGCLILIPSAVLTHANTPIQAGEKRASFTQYCAGALFRYVDNRFMTQDEFQASVSNEEFKAKMKEKETRWKKGLALFSTLDDLLERMKVLADQAKEAEEGQL
jgi:adenine-specific DNA glycosylase